MSKCANCGAAITCGCQKRTLPDGKSGCSSCVNRVNKKPVVETKKPETPTTKRVWGPDRYKNLERFTKK